MSKDTRIESIGRKMGLHRQGRRWLEAFVLAVVALVAVAVALVLWAIAT